MARKKVARLSGIKETTKYRDDKGRFTTREKSVSEEIWKYREGVVKGKKKIVDLRIEYLPYRDGSVEHFGTIPIPEKGQRAGKISAALTKTLSKLGVDRHDTRIDITMTGKTKSGKIIKRKMSLYHYNSRKLVPHTVYGIMSELFWKHGDRPAYPVKIVKGWRKRETTKKETMKRRELHDVTFTIKTEVGETRKQAAKRKTIKPKPSRKIEWGMDLTKEEDDE